MNRLAAAPATFAAILTISLPALAAASEPDSDETRIEQALASAAEQGEPPAKEGGFGVRFEGPVPGPLFVGVDDETVFTHRIDVVTDVATPVFDGLDVYGAAYDPVGDQVFFNAGSQLYVWPVGGAATLIGTVVDAAGATQVMVGLAFYNGTLYGTKNIANEAIWEIDTTTAVATVFIDYVDGDLDCGGFAADPSTGDFYCANDDSTPHGTGLVRINADASVTPITAYPVGETDIDGLAIGGGRAYLVIDQPGDFYVWDFGLAAYQTPLTSPWTTSEVFSSGAWIGVPAGVAGISLAKTVGTDPGVCAATDQIAVPNGTTVHYCFEVTNTGGVSLGLHDLIDSHLGIVLDDFAYALAPGASVFLVVPDVADATVTNTATWTATPAAGEPVEASDTATVIALDTLVEIPTLSGIGLAALAGALGALALFALRRRSATRVARR